MTLPAAFAGWLRAWSAAQIDFRFGDRLTRAAVLPACSVCRVRAIIVAAFLFFGTVSLGSAPSEVGSGQSPDGGPAAVLFDRAQTFLLRRDSARALELFSQAAKTGGDYAELGRLHQIRLLATEKRPEGESRAKAVRALLTGFGEPAREQLAWFLAAVSLYDSGETEAALDLAVEAGRTFDGTRWGGAARFLAAEIFFEKQELAPAADQLLRIVDDRENTEHLDSATFLLARIYLAPGRLHSRRRGLHLLERFAGSEPQFTNSIWRRRALALLARLGGSR